MRKLLYLCLTMTLACSPSRETSGPEKSEVSLPSTSSLATESVSHSEDASVEVEPKVLYEYTTKFKAGPEYQGRFTNISLLAEKLDGTILKPGGEFSFNKIVGPRTRKFGFKEAPTYFLGEVLPGVGGGTCQVSSTLFAAALHVNVEVTDRRSHSRVSSYIPVGLDATVNYPEECWDAEKPDRRICFDLKFKNPYDFDLVFKFKIGEIEDGKRPLTASILGIGEIPKVKTLWQAHASPPFKTRYRRISYWKNERKKLKQTGGPGLRGIRLVTITHSDGTTEKKVVRSKYQPVPEVWHVGTEFDIPSDDEEKKEASEASEAPVDQVP